MSGLIGQIGSRSGIIGRTELEYEEGKWTPSLAGSVATFTNSGQTGNYRRIGNMCYINCWVSNSGTATSSTGSIYFSGLPFTGATNTDSYSTTYSGLSISGSQFIDTDGVNVFARQYGGNTTINFAYIADDTIGTDATANLLDNGDSSLGVSGFYPIAPTT